MRRIGIFICLCLLGCWLCAQPSQRAHAETTDQRRQALQMLANQFVNRVGDGFEKADKFLDSVASPDDKAKHYFASIPDGEMLLLQINLGDMTIEQPVTGEKRGDDVMLSLLDFATAANFPISIDPKNKTADGWYIREKKGFLLDGLTQTVTINNRTYSITPGDIELRDDDILVKGRTLSKWMGFGLRTNVSIQTLGIVSTQKWPVQEQVERRKRAESSKAVLQPPKLPRRIEPYETASIPRADVQMRQSVHKPPQGAALTQTSVNTQLSGEFAKHSVRAMISGNETQKLASVRANFSKESEEPDLLGVLKARNYEFGDIHTVTIPDAGTSPSEAGFRISNKDPLSTSSTTTQVTGDAPPGWDVELRRNGQYIGLATVGDDGQYVFDDVFLFGGDNKLTISQFGPQGEIREETRLLNVNPVLYGADKGVYDVSLSRQNGQLWRKTPSNDPDKDTPHLAATYEKQISEKLSLNSGIRIRQENGAQKMYLEGGGTANVRGETIVNADAVYDIDGAYKTALTARRRYGKQQNLGLIATYESENFSPGNGTVEGKPTSAVVGMITSGPIPHLEDYKGSYEMGSRYIMRGDGSSVQGTDLSVSANVKRLSLSSQMSRGVEKNEIETIEKISGSSSIRGRLGKTSWRTTASYDVKPEMGVKQYMLRLKRKLTPKWDAQLQTKYQTIDSYMEQDLSLTWSGEHMTVSPSLTHDSLGDLNASVSASFGLAKDPYSNRTIMSGSNVTANGGLSASVFLDRDGDSLFTEGDEWLEGVTIEAIHARRQAETDENGNAFIYDLPTNRITDVVVQENSSFDPTWVSGFEGISIRPRPGHVTRVDFPIHISGEIDGTVYLDTDGVQGSPVRNLHLHLYSMKGKREQTTLTATDGFYLFTRVPPGRYYIIADAEDLRSHRLSTPLPKEIHIGYEGTIVSGYDLHIESGENGNSATMAFLTEKERQEFADMNPDAALESLGDGQITLNLGAYNSRLLMAVVWYGLKSRYAAVLKEAEPVVMPSDSYALLSTGKHILRLARPDNNLEKAWSSCRAIAARNVPCAIEIIPEREQKQAEADTTGKI